MATMLQNFSPICKQTDSKRDPTRLLPILCRIQDLSLLEYDPGRLPHAALQVAKTISTICCTVRSKSTNFTNRQTERRHAKGVSGPNVTKIARNVEKFILLNHLKSELQSVSAPEYDYFVTHAV